MVRSPLMGGLVFPLARRHDDLVNGFVRVHIYLRIPNWLEGVDGHWLGHFSDSYKYFFREKGSGNYDDISCWSAFASESC